MSPRSAQANRQIRKQQKDRILEAARDLFARHGFSATKISDIAAQAGVSHGLVHHYFGSKAKVFEALIAQVMRSASVLPREALERAGTPLQRLTWFVETLLAGVASSPESFFLVIEASANASVPASVKRLVADEGMVSTRLIAKLIRQGQSEGELRKGNPETLSTHLFALAAGLAMQQLAAESHRVVADADVVLGMLRR